MLNSLIYSNRATPYRAKSGLVHRPVSDVQSAENTGKADIQRPGSERRSQ